jgi:hypothetical protein
MKQKILISLIGPIVGGIVLFAANPTLANVGTGPAVNLFTPLSIESLSETSRNARELERSLESLIEKLETQSSLYEAADCSLTYDDGCQKLRRGMKQTYNSLLSEMQDQLPDIRASIEKTRDALADRMQSELGRKMTPGDLQRLVSGRSSKTGANGNSMKQNKGSRLSGLFESYYRLVQRNGGSSGSGTVLAAQLYIDSVNSAQYLDLIEAEIDSQHTELMLELEWVELTAQMNGTVDNVKTLLWGGTDNRHELLDIGLEYTAEKQAFSDLYVH